LAGDLDAHTRVRVSKSAKRQRPGEAWCRAKGAQSCAHLVGGGDGMFRQGRRVSVGKSQCGVGWWKPWEGHHEHNEKTDDECVFEGKCR
jgi:hypothetical protein